MLIELQKRFPETTVLKRTHSFNAVVRKSCNISLCDYLFACRFLPESPRWLLAKGRLEEALKILETLARINGTVLPDTVKQKLKVKCINIFQFVYSRRNITISRPIYTYFYCSVSHNMHNILFSRYFIIIKTGRVNQLRYYLIRFIR